MSITGFFVFSQPSTYTMHDVATNCTSMTLLNFLQPKPEVCDDIPKKDCSSGFLQGKLEHSTDYR